MARLLLMTPLGCDTLSCHTQKEKGLMLPARGPDVREKRFCLQKNYSFGLFKKKFARVKCRCWVRLSGVTGAEGREYLLP